jgi:hypothetical protein
MNTKQQNNSPLGQFPRVIVTSIAAVFFLSVCPARAAAPANSAVEMTFSEGSGTSTANTGFLAGSAIIDVGTTTNGFPGFSTNVPTGLYVPSGNPYSINFGPLDNNGGGRKVDLNTANGPFGTLGNFIGGLTICGWLNCVDNLIGSGGNRIAFALEAPNGLGFDLMQQTAGSIGFNVNQYNTAGPVSSLGMITENTNAAPTNWVFFAVTYDPSLSSGQVKFYFGRNNKLATFDVSRTYTGGITNQIEFTGALTVGNFSAVESQYAPSGTGSRTYRGLVDQLRIYTNILSVDEIQQAQLETNSVPAVPAAILRQPTNVVVTASPFKTATFTVDAHGSGAVTYQWRTNGISVLGATNSSFTVPADTTNLSGTLVSVYVDNSLTVDPGVLSSNALLKVVAPSVADLVIPPNDDVYYDNSGVWNAYAQSVQINWGLGAANGLATGQRRSYLEFSLGTNLATSAKLRLWNYWGGPPVNGQGRLAEATTRIYGSLTNAPITITEPPVGTHSDSTWIAPDNTNFFQISTDQLVGPDIGWYDFDITSWYNACRGQTTTVVMRGSAISGFDFPLYEDREGTAFTSGAGGTLTNTGPRIEVVLAPPTIVNVSRSGANLVMSGYYGKPGSNYVLIATTDLNLASSNWTRLATNQFDALGHFNVTNSIGVPYRFYRLLLP